VSPCICCGAAAPQAGPRSRPTRREHHDGNPQPLVPTLVEGKELVQSVARRSAYPCWFRVIGVIRVLAVVDLAESPPPVPPTDRKPVG